MYDQLYYTVSEASDLCWMTQTTIRKAIKSRNMKTYRDDRGVIHIYGPHIWDYRREIVTKKITKVLDEISACVRKLDLAKKEYLKAFADLEDCEPEEYNSLYSIWSQKKKELWELNRNYMDLVDALRNLEYEATVTYEVKL